MMTQCKEIENLMFLKAEELSAGEKNRLQDHLGKCGNCRAEYEQNMQLLEKGRFKSQSFMTSFLEARVIQNLEKYQERKSHIKVKHFRRLLLKAMAIASVFFFIIFSIEQANTINKITRLEQKLAGTNGKTVNQKGQLLVLNHFYGMDDLKQIVNPGLTDQAYLNSFFYKPVPGSLTLFNYRGQKLLKEVLESQPLGSIIFRGKFYGNSELLNPTF